MKKILYAISAMMVMALILWMGTTTAFAADYPTRPITLINPFSAGGSLDVIGRAFASLAEKDLGQPVVVVNKAGASGMIGRVAALQALPDGYTLAIDATGGIVTIETEIASGRKPPYTRNDFIPLGSFTLSPTLVVVPFNSPWKTLDDLIKGCKAKPNYYALGSGALATYMPAEVLMRATGITARHVPYKGGGPCINALVGGHIDFATQWPGVCVPLARGNKLRILAVQSDRRSKFVPEVPTVKELGIDAVWHQWVGISAPKKIPLPIVEKLKEVVKKVASDPTFINMIETQGDEVRYMSGEELAKYWDMESEKFAKLLKQLIEEKKMEK